QSTGTFTSSPPPETIALTVVVIRLLRPVPTHLRSMWLSPLPTAFPSLSKIPLTLLLLHRPGLVVVDHPALPLGVPRQQHLLDDLRQRRRVALDRPGQRVAAQRAEAHPFHHRLLAGQEPHPLVVHHDERAVALDDRADVGE